jgi:hypothetical protein
MARVVLLATRDPRRPNRLDALVGELNRKLAGDNIAPRPPLVVTRFGVCAAVLNATGAERVRGASIAVGAMLAERDDWHAPGAVLPDGSFALVRVDSGRIELAADATASHTLWYALTDDELVVSSSQRAIVALLGSFEPNRDVLPWMLSAGTLGPAGGWDARLKRVAPGERVVLDRARWRLHSYAEPLEVAADDTRSRAEHLERLRGAVADACRRWTFDARRWVLTLSGGADSRSLLCMLRDRGIETVTWGLPHTGEEEGNDARVAREVASALAVRNRFFPIAPHGETAEAIIGRFLAAGEGRVDRISGYVDGFWIWKTLFDSGYDGVIRGDEAFGWIDVSSPRAVRTATKLELLADYFSEAEIAAFELPEQRLPEALLRRDGETLATWRDRLYRQYRISAFLAALTDLKTAYLEVGNPLLARSVLECVTALPDELRTGKRLWLEVVREQLPGVPLARRVAIPSVGDFIASRDVLELLRDELRSARTAALFAAPLRTRCLAAVDAALREQVAGRPRGFGHAPAARAALPARLRAFARRFSPRRPRLDPLLLAFRLCLAARAHALLTRDAADGAAAPTDRSARCGGAS